MLIKYLTSCVGYGFSRNAGDVVDVRDAEGGRLIAAGLAERAAPPEPAAKPAKRKRKAKAKAAAVADDPAPTDAETADAPLLAGE